jgi:DNA-binding transcriptional LysR family regulator
MVRLEGIGYTPLRAANNRGMKLAKDPYDVMDLKQLRCFYAMAKHASLTRAGIELGINQSAVSQRIKALEAYLDVKLYETRGGRVRLTPAGEQTMSLAISLFDEIEVFQEAITTSDEAAEITLCAHDSILRYLLPDVVEAFYRAHPLGRLRLLARPVEETIHLVRANECDLGITPKRELPKELHFDPIATCPACLLLPKGHPLARRARIDFSSLLNDETVKRYPLIVSEAQLEGHLLKDALERFELPLNVALEAGTIETLKHYVARGLGIAAISTLCVTEDDHARFEVVAVPAELTIPSTYGVVMRDDKYRSAGLTSLLELLSAPSVRFSDNTR